MSVGLGLIRPGGHLTKGVYGVVNDAPVWRRRGRRSPGSHTAPGVRLGRVRIPGRPTWRERNKRAFHVAATPSPPVHLAARSETAVPQWSERDSPTRNTCPA